MVRIMKSTDLLCGHANGLNALKCSAPLSSISCTMEVPCEMNMPSGFISQFSLEKIPLRQSYTSSALRFSSSDASGCWARNKAARMHIRSTTCPSRASSTGL